MFPSFKPPRLRESRSNHRLQVSRRTEVNCRIKKPTKAMELVLEWFINIFQLYRYRWLIWYSDMFRGCHLAEASESAHSNFRLLNPTWTLQPKATSKPRILLVQVEVEKKKVPNPEMVVWTESSHELITSYIALSQTPLRFDRHGAWGAEPSAPQPKSQPPGWRFSRKWDRGGLDDRDVLGGGFFIPTFLEPPLGKRLWTN